MPEREFEQKIAAQKATTGLATGEDATEVARGLQNPEQKPRLDCLMEAILQAQINIKVEPG